MTSDLGRVIFGSRKKIAFSILHGSGARSNTRLDTHCERAMATPEQINAIVQVAVEASVSRLMEGLMPMIAANINTGRGRTTGNGGFGPSGKIFRDIGKFGGEEGVDRIGALVPDHSQRIRCGASPGFGDGAEQHHGSLHGEVRNALQSVRPPFERPCADVAPVGGWRERA